LETADTPDSYLRPVPAGKTLGKTMQVWKVQDLGSPVGKAGAVTAVINAEDSWDAEAILLGFAPGKTFLATGIGRHGNYLQWGWSAGPSRMTEAGRNLFINSICYIKKFDGIAPVIRDRALTRSRFLSRLQNATTDLQSAGYYFSPEMLNKYKNRLGELAPFYRENIDFLYQKGEHYFVDEELKGLGFKSNDDIVNLPKLINLLSDTDRSAVASRLLVRYTGKSFKTAKEWRTWFDTNRDRIVFSETGGYRFYAIPKPKTAPNGID